MTIRIFLTAIFISVLILGLPQGAAAEAVGHFTQVEGRVDLLKGGKLPATAVKVGDGVEQGDVLRTKSLSKAQVTFKDNSTLTISPESRIAIEEYMFDAAKGQRNALLQVFQGMVLAVVSKIYQTEKPDFVVKTHTAIMGIRGTEVGIRLAANDTTFLNFQGKTQVANIFPEVGDSMFKKANKIAFAQGQPSVMLKDSQGCTVARGLPPTLPYTIGPEDRKLFMRAFNIAPLVTKSGGGDAAGRGGGSAGGGGGSVTTGAGAGSTLAADTTAASFVTNATSTTAMPAVLIVPVITPPPPTPVVVNPTYTFSEIFNGNINMTTSGPSPSTLATFTFPTGQGTWSTGASSGTFTISNPPSNILATATNGGTFGIFGGDSVLLRGTGSVSGPAGGVLTGTMQLTGFVGGGTTPNFTFPTGQVTLQPTGNLTYQGTGTFSLGAPSGTATINLVQVKK
jgi:hypothetical protein